MKLDKRIIKGKKPLDCFDAENKELMKSFLNKEGYVSNNIANYCFLNKCPKRFLSNVFKEVRDCFTTHINGGNGGDWKYFLPAEWVKEPEKKYRPYTLAEWIGQHTIGDVIRYRCKSQKIELRHLYVGYGYGIGTDIKNTTFGTLTLGVASYTLDYLLEDYEIEVNGEWLPFGIEVEEKE